MGRLGRQIEGSMHIEEPEVSKGHSFGSPIKNCSKIMEAKEEWKETNVTAQEASRMHRMQKESTKATEEWEGH